tara:strand:- start:449 stop:1588 length:1140 start_codon:yes stop_codon:yes gene_type:complete
MRKATKLFPALAGAALLVGLAGCSAGGDTGSTSADEESAGSAATTEEAQQVFMLLPNTTTVRFEERDAPLFIEALAGYAPNAEVTTLNAEGDPTKQQGQMEDAITQGADVIVYVSADASLAAGALAVAEKAGVPVVFYEHDAVGGKAEAHVLFDALAVGRAQGKRAVEVIEGIAGDGLKVARIKGNPGEYGTNMYQKGQDEFLQPLIDSGKIEVVCEQNIANWDPVAGQAYIEDCLAQNGNDLDVIISMNDGLAGGSVAALATQGLEGQVVVTGGQDANLGAIQFIIKGYQDNTIFKDLAVMGDYAAQVVASILEGNGVPADLINGEIDNDYMMVPAVYLPVNNVTIDNVADVINAGLYSWAEACEGAEEEPICKENLQ